MLSRGKETHFEIGLRHGKSSSSAKLIWDTWNGDGWICQGQKYIHVLLAVLGIVKTWFRTNTVQIMDEFSCIR